MSERYGSIQELAAAVIAANDAPAGSTVSLVEDGDAVVTTSG